MGSNSKCLAKNTMMLTIKMLFLLVVNLYTSRVLLKALGVEDYGIYNAVGGIVTMFTIISGSITAAITRYLTYELGKGEGNKLSNIFSTSVIVQAAIAGIVILLAETVGLWFLNTHMNIPADRMYAANWVFQFSIITFAINLISIPYNAAIIAHEKMSTFAYISLYEGIFKLVVSYAIFISPIDTLIFYALALCFLSLSVRFIYTIYCKRKFNECTLRWTFDCKLTKEIFGFAGWNFIGATAGLLRDQGGNIVINIFCGPAANAARGIAYQVNSAVHSFLSSFTTAMHPQITKSYASGDNQYFMLLLFRGSKLSYFILFTLSLPILINTEYIVNLWLGKNPEHTTDFIRLVLILSMSEAISTPLVTAMLATGNIKRYQIIVGGLNMMNLPISYILLRSGLSPDYVFITAIIISQFCLYARLYLLKSMINLDSIRFFKDVYLKIIVATILATLPPLVLKYYVDTDIYTFIATSFVAVISSVSFIWFTGLTNEEREFAKRNARKIFNRFKKANNKK